MYERINSINGAQAVEGFMGEQNYTPVADGIEVSPPDDQTLYKDVMVPDRLLQWLVDLRLLRHIPLTYLVPDAALLPTESIRLFYVDPTWVDRVVDGAFAAARTGTIDLAFTTTILGMSRAVLDGKLKTMADEQFPNSWNANQPMTGMLIRSELVRRWPDMIVEAYSGANALPVMRKEAISRDVYIALFAGVPTKVAVREPFNGIRFGVEPHKTQPPPAGKLYQVDARNMQGQTQAPGGNVKRLDIPFRGDLAKRVINISQLGTLSAAGAENSPRQVALNLEQRPYRQVFTTARNENTGSQDLPAGDTLPLHGGKRVMQLGRLRKRFEDQQKLGGA